MNALSRLGFLQWSLGFTSSLLGLGPSKQGCSRPEAAFPFTGVFLRVVAPPKQKNLAGTEAHLSLVQQGRLIAKKVVAVPTPNVDDISLLEFKSSPDSRQVAFLCTYIGALRPEEEVASGNPQYLFVADLISGQSNVFVERGYVQYFAWSPKGDHLFIVEDERVTWNDTARLVVVNAKTRGKTLVAKWVKTVNWSLTGDAVVFTAPEKDASGAYLPEGEARTKLVTYIASVSASGVGPVRVLQEKEVPQFLGASYPNAWSSSAWPGRQMENASYKHIPNDEILMSPNGRRACLLKNYEYDRTQQGATIIEDATKAWFFRDNELVGTIHGSNYKIAEEFLLFPQFIFWAKDNRHLYGFRTIKAYCDTFIAYDVETGQERRIKSPDKSAPPAAIKEMSPAALQSLRLTLKSR